MLISLYNTKTSVLTTPAGSFLSEDDFITDADDGTAQVSAFVLFQSSWNISVVKAELRVSNRSVKVNIRLMK